MYYLTIDLPCCLLATYLSFTYIPIELVLTSSLISQRSQSAACSRPAVSPSFYPQPLAQKLLGFVLRSVLCCGYNNSTRFEHMYLIQFSLESNGSWSLSYISSNRTCLICTPDRTMRSIHDKTCDVRVWWQKRSLFAKGLKRPPWFELTYRMLGDLPPAARAIEELASS